MPFEKDTEYDLNSRAFLIPDAQAYGTSIPLAILRPQSMLPWSLKFQYMHPPDIPRRYPEQSFTEKN